MASHWLQTRFVNEQTFANEQVLEEPKGSEHHS